MRFHALCYLISSCAGDIVTQCGSARLADHDMTTLCRLLADAVAAPNTGVLEMNNLSLVVHAFKGFFAAAVISPDSQVAEAAFEAHLLAVLFQLGTLQFGSVLDPALNRHCTSRSSIEQLRSCQKIAMNGLSLVLQTPGVFSVELVTIDMHDKCCHITELMSHSSHAGASKLLWPAVHTACRSLLNVMQAYLLRDSSVVATNSKQTNVECSGAGLPTTFSAICLGCGQEALHRVAVVKCLHVLDLCMFVVVWSNVHLLDLVALRRLNAKPHVKLGKAAVPSDMRIKLNTAVAAIKKGFYRYT